MAVALACVTAAAGSGSALAAAPRASVGSVPRLPAGARVTGGLARTRRISLMVSLSSRDPLLMQSLAQAVATPGSPDYRDYLTVGQFARRFGATPAHIRAVSDALRAAGLQVAPVAANHLTLTVTGTTAQVQDAFATRLAAVRLSDGERAFSERQTPTLPASIAPDVDAVVGLNTIARPQGGALPDSRPASDAGPTPDVATGGPQACTAAAAVAGRYHSYTADTIQAAYNFTDLYAAGAAGQRQTVAVYELESVRASDLRAFQHCYGTHVPISYVNIDHPRYAGDDGESALDIEQIIGLAPRVRIIVYAAQDTAAGSVADFARIMSQDRAKTVSVSWGGCERKLTAGGTDLSLVRAEDHLFQEAALQGQSILSATGDTGSAGCVKDLDSQALAVQDPSSQPFATAVGGTTLFTASGSELSAWNPTAPLYESVWNDGIQTIPGEGKVVEGTGGGISTLWSMPSYQRGAAAALGVRNAHSSGGPCHSSGDCREVPDVSLNADPNLGYVVHVSGDGQSGWTVEGGTSAAAPVWAALTADADSLAACRGASIGFENPSLYDLASAQPGDLRPITLASPISGRGDNDATGSNHGLFPVTSAYSMATGLGAPDAAAIGAGLCALRSPVYTIDVVPVPRPSAVVGARFHLALRGTDSGRLRLRFSARGLPRGLRIDARGVISGRARRVGRYTVTVTATDHARNRGVTRFVLSVLTPPARFSRVGLSGVARSRPGLGLAATHGVRAPDLRSVRIYLPAGLALARRHPVATGRARASVRAVAGGALIVFRHPQGGVRITLRLIASPGLVAAARHDRRARVTVTVVATDRRGRVTVRRFALRLH